MPDAGLVCILWRCSAVVVSLISVASYLVFVSPYMLCFPLRLSNVRALAVGLVMYFTLSLDQAT